MEIELTVRSPVHIGVDEERSPQEYVFERGRAYKPNLDRYFDTNPDEIDAFVSDMEDGRSMAEFFDGVGSHASYVVETWTSEGEIGGSNIQPFIKTRGEEPYIPGSSLKGAIRTALACQVLREGTELRAFEGDSVEELFCLEGIDPQRDVMRCLTVRDATPTGIEESQLALCKIKTHSLQESGEMKPKFWSTYAECLQPGTTLSTELHVDVELLEEMTAEFGHREVVETLFGRDWTESGIVDRIETALDRLGEAIVEQDRELTGEFDAVESFYDDLTENGAVPLRVGFGTGWHSNTVGTALSEAELLAVRGANELGKPTRHRNCGGILVDDDHNPGQLFCTECYTGGIAPDGEEVSVTPFPKTRRLVHRNGIAEFPIGWVTLERS